jgi:eukaryotic-like serine/threonine-protein kinase
MFPEQWNKIGEIFETAVEIAAPAEREIYLAEACGGDVELRAEVEKLLRQDAAAEDLLNAPVMENSGLYVFAEMIENDDPMIGKIIGVYRLEKEIGRGGMGTVYLAERADGSFRQRVAIKLIKRGMDTDFILRRFRQERQILAALNHPNIARLLDGGTTTDDLPYFVMEYIEGKPLYKFSDERKLSIAERLNLFRQVCNALDFAHENQVIHRDIKPPNILVTQDGVPKLLDFGIAKVLDPDLSLETIDPTATAMRLMTPEYASPEQVSGAAVSPASDIYSLGVLLYELLTGHRPYQFQNRTSHEIARVICEEEPLRPSTGITREDNLLPTGASEATTLEDIFTARGAANLQDLQRELSGDLEKVILKCLRKNPPERYQTAAGLSADITRFLNGKAVAAESYYPNLSEPPVQNGAAKSLAVLPLKILNLAPNVDTGEEFLSVGLADAMIARLSGIKSLAVRPTSAIVRYGGDSINPLAAGAELGVNFVLDGRIKIVAKRIRVSLQLLDVKNSTSIWANQFDEIFTDALELEDSISSRVAEAVLPQLTETKKTQIKKRGTDNAQAFESYLRGRFYWNQFTPDSLPKALKSFENAVELDPNYALAYVGLADFYLWANIYGIIPSTEATIAAEKASRRAVALDETMGEAYASLGLSFQNRMNWAEAKRLYLKSLELTPNYVHAHEWHSAWLVGNGQFAEGIAEIKRAEQFDPLSLRTKTLTAWTLYQSREFEAALRRANQILEMDKNYPQGYLQLSLNLQALGETGKALAASRKFDEMIPDSGLAKFQLCFALVADNRRAEAQSVLEELKFFAAGNYVKPFFLAMAHVALDERDEAFRLFEISLAEYEPWMLWFGTEPQLEKLHDDRRYIALLERMNNPLARKFKSSPKF